MLLWLLVTHHTCHVISRLRRIGGDRWLHTFTPLQPLCVIQGIQGHKLCQWQRLQPFSRSLITVIRSASEYAFLGCEFKLLHALLITKIGYGVVAVMPPCWITVDVGCSKGIDIVVASQLPSQALPETDSHGTPSCSRFPSSCRLTALSLATEWYGKLSS